jgi:hypothetical protein
MPIITAYQGTILVEGKTHGNPDAPSYRWELTAYGATIGELLDNLVNTSVVIANDVFAWVMKNKPEGYELDQDYWYVLIKHPEILEVMTSDTGSGGSVESIEGIVRYAALIRDIHVSSTANWLLLQNRAESEIVDKAINPYNGIYSVSSFSEMTKFGFTGTELDTMLAIGEKEGRVKEYQQRLYDARSYRKQASEKAAKNATKTHWWKKLVA